MKKIIQNIKFAGVLALVLSLIALVSCEEDDAELPEVTAGFTYTLDEDTGAVTFFNTSEEASMYSWDFGDGRTSTEINPMRAFGTGEYKVTLTAKNAAGGSDSFTDTVVINIPLPMNLPVTFDDPNVNYAVNTFNGTSFQIVDNPDVSGSNDKASQVGEIVNSGNQFEGITFDVGMAVDLTSEKTITMNFWSETAIPVLLKLEQGTGADVEVTANHTGSGWESLQFDFNSSASYSRITIFADGPGTTAAPFYIDDIAQIETPIPPFDSGLLTNGDFESGSEPWIGNGANVVTEGANSFNFVNVETAGNPYDVNLSQVVEITQGTNYILTFTASSDGNRTILAGIGLNEEPFTNTAPEINLTSETQTFTLQLSAADFGGANSRVLFDMGADTGVVVLDNISLVEGGDGSDSNTGGVGSGGCTDTPVAAKTLPLGFEGCETFLSEQNFGDGITSELAPNPDKSGINTSDFVLKVEKPAGSSFFAGIQNTFENNFDLSTTNTFKVKVYSTKANVVMRFELAVNPQTNPVTGNPAPVFVTIADANVWTDVSVMFTNLPGGPTAYNQLVIKPDNDESNSAIDTDGTYYFDDLRLEASSVGGGNDCASTDLKLPLSFDCDNVNYNFETFNGASYELVDNPELSGANDTASKVGKIVNIGAEYEGGAFALDTPVNFAEKKIIKAKVYSTVAVPVLLKFEGAGAPVETSVNHTGSGWEELTFTFTTSDTFNKLVLFIDGPGKTAGTFYVDEFIQIGEDVGGGNTANLITNGDFEAGETGWLFFDVDTSNGGQSGISTTENNTTGGSQSARVQSGKQNNPGIKQERFGVGSIQPNQQLSVSLDSKVESLVDGAVVNVLAFSESATEGNPAVLHNLGSINIAPGSWNTNTYTFTTAGDVSGGVSLLLEVVCGGADSCEGIVYFDNVVVKAAQ